MSQKIMQNDGNELIPISDGNKGICKKKNNTIRKRDTEKRKRYSATGEYIWLRTCSRKNKNVFKCTDLTEGDVLYFRRKLFEKPHKIQQDNFLLLHVNLNIVKRKTRTADKKPHQSSNSYMTGHMAEENRGGDRKSHTSIEKRNSVGRFIGNFKGIESHYGRNKSVRMYVPAEMKSIPHLWCVYNRSTEEHKVKFTMFYRIFVNEFNTGFRSARVDTCAFCERTKYAIKNSADERSKQENIANLRVHKLRAKAFYDILRQMMILVF
ncbi:Hypothetical predicted protein [Octopus vulgaris]|uniref:Uncharacterized protein n=1 Tax=Octopus vulgaris TaxID=6645 RepID=A0AA36EYH4_OCTVU|nr:Hypothetical predicted protein [Octopus vulgaris]